MQTSKDIPSPYTAKIQNKCFLCALTTKVANLSVVYVISISKTIYSAFLQMKLKNTSSLVQKEINPEK